MSPALLLLLALGLGLVGWLAARARAWSFRRAQPDGRLAALPTYHAWYVALWVVVPAATFALIWSGVAPGLIAQSVLADPAAVELPPFGMQRDTMLAEARAVATGSAPAVFNPGATGLVQRVPQKSNCSVTPSSRGRPRTTLSALRGGAAGPAPEPESQYPPPKRWPYVA